MLEARFSPENKMLNAASGKVQLTVWAVPSAERKATEDLLTREGLPVLCRWIAKAQSEANAWRGFVHTFAIETAGSGLRFREEYHNC